MMQIGFMELACRVTAFVISTSLPSFLLAAEDQVSYSCYGQMQFETTTGKTLSSTPVRFKFMVERGAKALYSIGDVSFNFTSDAKGSIIDSADETYFQHTIDAQIQTLIFTKKDKFITYGTTFYDHKKRVQIFSRKVSASCDLN